MSRAPPFAPTSIGVIGYGAFGRLMATALSPYFDVYAYDPSAQGPGLDAATGAVIVSSGEAARQPVVALAAPVDRLEDAIGEIASHLQPGALVLDVGSVKVGPAEIMRRALPASVDIIGTHPLFGPQSAAAGLQGLKIALCPIRGERAPRVAAFLRRMLGLQVFVTTPESHDRELAVVQGLTHLIAKVLVGMEPLPTRMTTRSFDLMVRATEMVRNDAPEVFLAIVRDNPYAAEVRDRFFGLAEALHASLEAAPRS